MANDLKVSTRITVDTSSIKTEVPAAARQYEQFAASMRQAATQGVAAQRQLGDAAEDMSRRGTRSFSQLSLSLRDIVIGSTGLTVIASAVRSLGDAIMALPRSGFNFSRDLEVSQMGMAGILGSMTAINGQQTSFQQGMAISADMIRKLNDDALRTAATSQELTTVFQALLAPGLAARMTLDQVRELTVVGTNAVKSMGLDAGQVVQELRDLVAGGITPASSTLATALGLKDSDIAKAKASSEGLFAFLMERLKGFEASSQAFGDTMKGKIDQLQEGATRVAAEGMVPLTAAIKEAIGETANLFVTFDKAGNAELNPKMVEGVRHYAESAANAMRVGRDVVSGLWEHREAITSLAAAYTAFRLGQWASEAVNAVRAQLDLAQASRLARIEAAAQAAGNAEVTLTSRQKVAALMAELQARQAAAQADAAAATAQLAQLAATTEAIALSRSETIAKMEAARATMVQAEAQIQAARAAGAQSFALAAVREATTNLTAAQARHAALMTELAVLGQQQARVQASVAAATVAQTTATAAATTAASGMAAATGAASIAARGFGVVVGALGGPVGIAILAVSGLAMWLARLKGAADDAATAGLQIKRAEEAAAAGKRPEARDFARLPGEIEKLKTQRDELLLKRDSKPGYRPRGDTVSGDVLGLAPTPATLADLDKEIAQKEAQLERLTKASQGTGQASANLTLTLAGAEQAWAKANDGVKTASSVQEEYTQKLQASRTAFVTLEAMLRTKGASPDVIKKAQSRQSENEAALARERDKQLKSLAGNDEAKAARAEGRDIDARVEGIRHGYKLMALQTADGIDAIDSLRKQEIISESGLVMQKRDLQLKDLKNKEIAIAQELALVRGKKDSAKQQQTLEGELSEAQQQRINIENKANRDLQELFVAPQLALLKSTREATQSIYEQAEALEAQNLVHGQSKTALIELSIAQLQSQRNDLENTNSVVPGYIEAVNQRIEALKRLKQATGEAEGLEKADELKKKREDEARKTSEDIRGVFRDGIVNALDGGDNAFASMGKALKKTIITSIADAFYDATLKQAVDGFSKWLSNSITGEIAGSAGKSGGGSGGGLFGLLFKGIVGGFGGTSSIAGANLSTSFVKNVGMTANGMVPMAKGGVFESPSLSAYSSGVFNTPRTFAFAKGAGIFAEAGPEAIMPLRRGSDGRLGVTVQGAAAAAPSVQFAPTNVFNIDARSDRAAILADMGRVTAENNKAQMDQLKRIKVVPQ